MRHAFASLTLLGGIHRKIFCEALGHASVAFTLDTYGHLIPNLQQAAMRRLDEVLPPIWHQAWVPPTSGSVSLWVRSYPHRTALASGLAPTLRRISSTQNLRLARAQITGKAGIVENADRGEESGLNTAASAERWECRQAPTAYAQQVEPTVRFELTTGGLRNRCSTPELRWHGHILYLITTPLATPIARVVA